MSAARLLLLPIALAPLAAAAQGAEHPFIERYGLTELPGAVRVEWTLNGGSTCNGQDVERSLDSITFVSIHHIEGICGGPVYDAHFSYIDADPPPNTTVHYRVKLGLSGYSSVRSIRRDEVQVAEAIAFPSPTPDRATLLLPVAANARVDVIIFDAQGHEVYVARTVGRSVVIDLTDKPSGTYFYRATAAGRTFVGRVVRM